MSFLGHGGATLEPPETSVDAREGISQAGPLVDTAWGLGGSLWSALVRISNTSFSMSSIRGSGSWRDSKTGSGARSGQALPWPLSPSPLLAPSDPVLLLCPVGTVGRVLGHIGEGQGQGLVWKERGERSVPHMHLLPFLLPPGRDSTSPGTALCGGGKAMVNSHLTSSSEYP